MVFTHPAQNSYRTNFVNLAFSVETAAAAHMLLEPGGEYYSPDRALECWLRLLDTLDWAAESSPNVCRSAMSYLRAYRRKRRMIEAYAEAIGTRWYSASSVLRSLYEANIIKQGRGITIVAAGLRYRYLIWGLEQDLESQESINGPVFKLQNFLSNARFTAEYPKNCPNESHVVVVV